MVLTTLTRHYPPSHPDEPRNCPAAPLHQKLPKLPVGERVDEGVERQGEDVQVVLDREEPGGEGEGESRAHTTDHPGEPGEYEHPADCTYCSLGRERVRVT